MAYYYDETVLVALLNAIKNGATRVVLLSTYTEGQSWAIVDGNVIAEGDAALTAGSFSGPSPSGLNQQLTFSGAAGTASVDDATPDDLHIALMDDTYVYVVTDETSDQPINSGNPVTFPAFYMQASQPTVAT